VPNTIVLQRGLVSRHTAPKIVRPFSALKSLRTNTHYIARGVVDNLRPLADSHITADFALGVTLTTQSSRVVGVAAASSGARGALLVVVQLDALVVRAQSCIHRGSDGRSQTSRAGADELPSHVIILRSGFEATLVAVAGIWKFTTHVNGLAFGSGRDSVGDQISGLVVSGRGGILSGTAGGGGR